MSYKIGLVPNKNIDIDLVNRYLKRSVEANQFTNSGPNVQILERFIKENFKIVNKSVICVTNGTVALYGLCAGIEYSNNKKNQWATQSFTFPPSAQGFLSGAKIIDIDKGGGIDLEKVGDEIDGIIVTNVFGNVVDISKYIEWANKNNKYLVFDNAATSYTFYKGLNALNYGTGSTISFHHTKPLGFGEGGAIIVDTKYEQSIRRIINFGLDVNVPWHPLGSNYKMSEPAAVYILQYLSNLSKIISHHCSLYSHLYNKLSSELQNKGISLFPNFSDGLPFLSCFCLLFEEYDDKYRHKLIDNGIFCRKYYRPLDESPVANEIYNSILCIPCTINMSIADLDLIIDLLFGENK